MKINIVFVRLVICAALATALALTSHIIIQKHTSVLLTRLMATSHFVPMHSYPRSVVIAAYITAFFDMFMISLMYYWVGGTIKFQRRWLKALVIAASILIIKMSLVRQPVMNYLVNTHSGMPQPFLISILPLIDVWIANIILSFVLVYFCPVKHYSLSA